MRIEDIKKIVTPMCRDYSVKRLDVFGSAARGAMDASSDVDFLVEFKEPEVHSAKRFFGLLHCLEDSLGCQVDLLTVGGLRNPYFRKRILAERIPLYEG